MAVTLTVLPYRFGPVGITTVIRDAGVKSEAFLLHYQNFGVREMRLGNENTGTNGGIKLTRAEECAVTKFAADTRPLDGFKSNAVGASQPR